MVLALIKERRKLFVRCLLGLAIMQCTWIVFSIFVSPVSITLFFLPYVPIGYQQQDGAESLELNALEAENVVLSYQVALCPVMPSALVGQVEVRQPNVKSKALLKWSDQQHRDLFDGGHFRPPACIARQKVAIVIPYRNRDHHLRIYIEHILPILKRQLLEFKIYVVEQAGTKEKFNRGTLFNIGFAEALRDNAWQCVIFHDVDLLPENDRNMYVCDEKQPKHLSAAIDKFEYSLPYDNYVGGIDAFPVKTFRDINGFSNLYWGWGGEDDDLWKRVALHPDYHFVRPDAKVARYKMIVHSHSASGEERDRISLLKASAKHMNDGLSTLKYKVLRVEKLKLFTKLMVNIEKSDYRQ